MCCHIQNIIKVHLFYTTSLHFSSVFTQNLCLKLKVLKIHFFKSIFCSTHLPICTLRELLVAVIIPFCPWKDPLLMYFQCTWKSTVWVDAVSQNTCVFFQSYGHFNVNFPLSLSSDSVYLLRWVEGKSTEFNVLLIGLTATAKPSYICFFTERGQGFLSPHLVHWNSINSISLHSQYGQEKW